MLSTGFVRLRFSQDFVFDGVLGLGLESLSQTSAFNFLQVPIESMRASGGIPVIFHFRLPLA